MKRACLSFLFLALVVCALDQISKYFILLYLPANETVEVVPGYFNLTLAFNRGAAFGLLSDLQDGTREIVLGLTTALALVVVLYFVLVEYRKDKIAQIALALILGGAFGNIIDRLRLGMVVDFLDFYLGQYHWPAFNAADSFICIGVAVLILRRPRKAESGEALPESSSAPS